MISVGGSVGVRGFVAFITVVGLGACSLYQSPGRKFLEKQAFEYAGVKAQAYQMACEQGATLKGWAPFSQSTQAHVFTHETNEFQIRVVTAGDPLPFSCDYQFASAQEMYERVGDAIDLTLAQSHAE
ncbi:MAG: hypothetical protein KF799_12070 [Bdellovibrionales bacterium]|nr:hypothetical protein [Bdellovibrionales bacterium]